MKRVDPIAFVEGCYRFDLDLRSWMALMALMAGLVAPEFDRGFGVVGWSVRFPARFRAEPVGPAVIVGGPQAIAAIAHAITVNTPPREVCAAYFAGRPLRTGSELAIPGSPLSIRENTGDFPIKDVLGLATVDGEGFALSFGGPSRQLLTTTAADRARWMPLAPHLAAGFRLRRRLTEPTALEPEAIFTPEGKCLDAQGQAQSTGARESLRRAVRAVERSRGSLRRKAPALSEPERQVVNFAAAGEPNKLIAYTLDRGRLERAKVTSAEREVAEAIVGGATNAQIAAARKTSVRTVANQVAALLHKLEVRSRTDLVARLASRA